jgi:hypothetical protein
MKIIDRALDILGVIFDPRFWLRNAPICHDYSDDLDARMSANKIPEPYFIGSRKSECTVMFDGVQVWIENWPYGFGRIYWAGEDEKFTMRRRTALRFRRLLKQEGIIGGKPYVSPFGKEMDT